MRSSQGLLVHVFGRLVAAMFVHNSLATKRLIRIEGAIFIAPVNDRFTFNQHRERLN